MGFLSEKIVLGNLLISNEALDLTIRSLSIDAFYFESHQKIYKAILILYKQKKIIDITTLTSYLQDEGILESIGGIISLTELVNQVPNLVNLEQYITLIQDKFLRRSLIKLGYQIINSGYITNIPLENILYELETELFNLTKKTDTNKILTSAELLANIYVELQQKSLKTSLPGLSSGFYDLDSLTQGFQKSDFIR